ncbi:MAG: EAL domain-containing protein [Methylophilaceae bacterium]|nr:MAG: EAL domain-containing protein [Methylophilaceae bacterium]
MKKIALFKHLLQPLLVIGTIAVFTSAFYLFSLHFEATEKDAIYETQKLEHVLMMAKSLVSERVYSSMALLKQKSNRLGLPSIHGVTILQKELIPKLQLGSQSQTNQTDLVDSVTNVVNGTATLFVKKDNAFIRIATNIKQNNRRVVGTRLDPNGIAIKHLIKGQAFYGVVDILGEPYISGYEPIMDINNQVIGAWYVGYKVNVGALDQAIKEWGFLKNGFAAVTDYNDNIRFLSKHTDIKQAASVLKETDQKWFVAHRDIPEWNFHAYIAFPIKDAYINSIASLYPLLVLSGIFGVALIVVAQRGIHRFVLAPLGGEPETASRLLNSIRQGNFDEDNTMAEPHTLIANILEMRSRLRHMVSEIKENADRLNISSSVFQHAHDGIFITDVQGNIIETNPAFTEISGYSREEAMNKQPHQLGFSFQLDAFFSDLFDAFKFNEGKQGEVWCQQKNGKAYAAWLDMFPVRDAQGTLMHYIGLFTDNTLAKEQQNTLKRLAYHHALTQLPNRVLFSDKLQQSLALVETDNGAIAICYIDLDNFKPINDQHGHAIGDQLLVLLADRLRDNCRNHDTVARLGGDEFAILLNDLPTAAEYSKALDRILHAIELPFHIDDHTFYISASIGFTVYPNDNNPPDILLRHADHAMYHAKTNGGKQHHLFDLNLVEASQHQQRLTQDVTKGLKNNEFLIYYQPQVNLKTGAVMGAEALIRWQHPNRGFLNPNDFLPAIEHTQLIIDIGEWVILNALAQLEQWRNDGLTISIAINIAAHHIIQQNFYPFLEKALQQYPDMLGNKLNIEITESAAINDFENVAQTIKACKNLGVTFSIDDFGVGYSSLISLRKLPIDIIKIDRSFTSGMLNDTEDLAVVTSIVTLSRQFNRKVVAEGAENHAQLHQLRTLECAYAQGYGIAKPMPAHQMADWIKVNHPFKY